jgi:hypothetical protein
MPKLALRARLFIRRLWLEVRRWAAAQETGADHAVPRHRYGGGYAHRDVTYLHVETDRGGTVVAVWFRCFRLPFIQVTVPEDRAKEMLAGHREVSSTLLTGVEVDSNYGQ